MTSVCLSTSYFDFIPTSFDFFNKNYKKRIFKIKTEAEFEKICLGCFLYDAKRLYKSFREACSISAILRDASPSPYGFFAIAIFEYSSGLFSSLVNSL